jgi:hypothetical protein
MTQAAPARKINTCRPSPIYLFRQRAPILTESDKERLASSLTDPLYLPEIGGVLEAHFEVSKIIDYRALYSELCEREARGEIDSTTVDRERDRLIEEEKSVGGGNYTLVTDWRVKFTFESSDKRYVPAHFRLQSAKANELCLDFKGALNKMDALHSSQFGGTYNRTIPRREKPGLSVWAQDGTILTYVSARSRTDRRHTRALDIQEMHRVVECFMDLPRRGKALCDTLRLLEE